jgi:hypothetical protein
MRPFVNWYTRICLLSALGAIVVQNVILTNLPSLQSVKWLGRFTPALAATGIYFLLYRSLIWLYELRGWRLVLKKYDISGIWYHEYLSPTDPSYVRHGITVVDQGVWHLTFNGRNYDVTLTRESLTLWNSTAVALENNARLVVAYTAHRCDQTRERDPHIEKTGILLIDVIRDGNGRPCRMIGIYEDTSPSERRGAITWHRETEWSQSIREKKL